MFGLSGSDIAEIRRVVSQYAEVEEVYLFGSRALGTFHNGSDIDLVLKGKALTFSVLNKISFELNEESMMPYRFDVLNYHTIQNDQLIDHINRVGVSIFQRCETSISKE